MGKVIEIELSDAGDFLDAISPWHAENVNLPLTRQHEDGSQQLSHYSRIIYRGHANARWKLLPTVLRTEWQASEGSPKICIYNRIEKISDVKSNLDKITAEAFSLWQFFLGADALGLSIPEDGQFLRRDLERWAHHAGHGYYQLKSWPPTELLSLMALAQHYRVPTRLLDFTFNPFAAAYFAASEAADDKRRPTDATHIGVWAIDGDPLRELSRVSSDAELQVVTASTYGNPNLHAQGGTFLLHRSDRDVIPHELDVAEPIDVTISR